MNKKTTLMLTATLLLAGSAAALQAQNNLTVTGKIEGIKSGRLYLIARTSETRVDTLGTASFKAPKFTLEGKLTEPIVAQIVVEKYDGGFTFLAEPGATYQALLKNGEGAYIKGGKLQDEWAAYVEHSTEQRQKQQELKENYEKLRAEGKYRSASAANDTLQAFTRQMNQETQAFLSGHDDLITAYTMQSNAVASDAGLEASRQMYNSMGPGAQNTPSGRMMKERIDRMEKTTTGRPAPDFTLSDPQGNPVTLSKVPGKIKLLDFWASWCGPCRLNNPALKKTYEQYHDKGLEIISVSLDDKQQRWTEAIAKDGLPWINVSSLKGWKCDVARQYNVTAVPAIFVLNENNQIIATNLRGEKLNNFLKDQLE